MPRTIIAGDLFVRPAQLERAKRAFITMEQATRREPGCLHFGFSQDLAEPTRFRVFEDWRSAEALAEHMNTPHLQRLLEELDHVLDRPLTMTQYEVRAREGAEPPG